MIEDLFYFNGINGDTGEYDLDPMSPDRLFDVLRGVAEPENVRELQFRVQWETEEHLGVVEGVDPTKIEESGWGVIFPADRDGVFVPGVKDALKPLLDLRKEQAGDFFRIYEGVEALRPGESKMDFLVRHGVPPADPANPEKMPYYLLLVGDPEQISYRFQSQLDVQYAVGRIHFETLQEYANYAASVVAAETGKVTLPKKASFFSVMNADDRATTLSNDMLMQPLLTQMQPELQDWSISGHMKEAATKAQLTQLLGGDETPALLFTASHGVPFQVGSARQIPHQGALLCQDWPGPQAWRGRGAIPQDHYFAGDDISSDANLLGMMAFFFACYGGGTPQHDDFPKPGTSTLNQIAAKPFISRLPMQMLSQEKGGALAVIGHVERAWGASFTWGRNIEQTDVFRSTLTHLMEGKPVGSALEYFNSRYATWATELSTTLRDVDFGLQVEPVNISSMWTAHNDARGYAIIGDPAVRLPLAQDDGAAAERPAITAQPASGSPGTPVDTPADTPEPISGETATDFSTTGPADSAAPDDGSTAGESSQSPASQVTSSGATMTVSTFTADQPDADRTLVAQTKVTPGSEIDTTVFGAETASNDALLNLHKGMVSEALSSPNRQSGPSAAMTSMSPLADDGEEEEILSLAPVEPPTPVDPSEQSFLPQVTDFLWVAQARDAFKVTGEGLTVAVLDTGLNTEHVDFAGRIVDQMNYTPDNGRNTKDATDGNGHGTNVTGIIAANKVNIGIAPGANIIPMKVLPDRTSGDFGWIADALQWVIDNRNAHNITAVCMSLGDSQNLTRDTFSLTSRVRWSIRRKIQRLKDMRVAVVIAAGNDYARHRSQQGMSFPAIVRECISVGAVYDADGGGFSYNSGARAFSSKRGQITPFSQRLHSTVNSTTNTDIFAPGAPVTATGIGGPEESSTQSGTSQATPVVTGLILLLQEFYMRWQHELPTVEQLVRWLQEGGRVIFDGDDEDDNVKHTNLTYFRADALSALDVVRREIHEKELAEKLSG